MNKKQVLEYLPHRPPFLFIDSVQEVIIPKEVEQLEQRSGRDLVGTEVVASFEVKESLEILAGHFPGNPILPGVVQIEMMAQASAFVSLALTGVGENVSVETLLLGVENAKFRKPIVPGMSLEIRAKMDKCRGTIANYACQITSDGEKISEVKILAQLKVVEKE